MAKKYVCEIQYERYLTDNGKVRGIENRFRNKDYLRELEQLLAVQSKFYDEIEKNADAILEIYKSKESTMKVLVVRKVLLLMDVIVMMKW